MNSNNNVDQAAALIMCSQEKAKALGIPQEKWIYPWAGSDAHDHYYLSNRDNFYSSPAIRLAGNRCLEMAGVEAQDLDMVDVYSCFPVAVQIASRELKLDTTRPLTVTGGLTWAGGPLNNYVMHSIVRMAQLLRERQGQKGLITANGGYITKHAFGVYSSEPPSQAYQHADLQTKSTKPLSVTSRSVTTAMASLKAIRLSTVHKAWKKPSSRLAYPTSAGPGAYVMTRMY